VQGEVRTLLGAEERAALLARIERAFVEAAQSLGGSVQVSFDAHCDSYSVDLNEPLLHAWAQTLEARGQELQATTTFIGSDTSALRRYAQVFTVSTGAMEEHTSDEWIALAPLAELTETALALLSAYRTAPGS
jgi:di/tripeptidase